MEYGNHKKHSAGARNFKARAKRALLLPSAIEKLQDFHKDKAPVLCDTPTHAYVYV